MPILDEALDHAALAESFPVLQASVMVDERALGRLHRALELAKAPIESFYNLAYGRVPDAIAGPEFRELVFAIARRSRGSAVGLELISMRLYSDRIAKREPLPEVREAGRIVLDEFELRRRDNHTTREDYKLGVIVRATLAGPNGASVARRLCRKLITAAARYDISGYDHDDLKTEPLSAHHPSRNSNSSSLGSNPWRSNKRRDA